MIKTFEVYKITEKIECYETELTAHKIKCHNIFNAIKNGELLYINIEQVLSENNYIEEISLEDTQYIRISLLTDEMIEYDLEMFRSENRIELLNKYRPYFTSFVTPLEDNSLSDIRFLGNSWYFGQFVNAEEPILNEGVLFKGILETSASPVNYLDKKLLVFTNKAIPESVLEIINNTYNPHNFILSSSLDIEKVLNNAWRGDFPNTIDIYNVGHGNADYIRGSNNRILYDIGYNYRSFPRYYNCKYLRAVNAIRKLKPSCVILSHWDMDHIIGCAYAEQDIFCKKWIAPSLVSSKDKKATPNAIRLAHYLKALGNLCLVDREQKNKLIATISCANNTEMRLWLGSGVSILTPKNREGLMLEIVDKNMRYSHILLAGDVPYQCMPNILKNPIDFMHVPHHCSNMELDKLKSISGKGICAIISTNRKKDRKLNYDTNHHNELANKFTDVINTIDNSLGDTANLSVQINYKYSNFYFR